MNRFLIIQTAFIGDVILATAVVEKLYKYYPEAKIDFLLRKGNEGLLENHPFINEVLVWNKQDKKYDALKQITRRVKQNNYDVVVNLHRFASSGLITAFSGAKLKIGFKKNPLSATFTKKYPHDIGNGSHEIERNQLLIKELTDEFSMNPKLYPTNKNYDAVVKYRSSSYVCMAPTSVWNTKQLPKEQWVKLINKVKDDANVYLLGGPNDFEACDEIIQLSKRKGVENLCGKLSFLESAALMQTAQMNYTNDSAPLHIASATNAPITAFFCSTVPEFGFGPLSEKSKVIQTQEALSCRPCGLHGKKSCPEGHFDCGYKIEL